MSVTITTPRLQLRNLIASDAQNMVERFTTPSIQKALNIPAGRSYILENRLAKVTEWQKTALISNLMLAIVRRSDGQVIGQADFGSLDLDNKVGEAGIVLDDKEEIRGKGYAVEALTALFGYGFDSIGLDTIMVGTGDGNLPMRGVMEMKFGAVGERKQDQDGDWCRWYVLSKKDWLAARKEGKSSE